MSPREPVDPDVEVHQAPPIRHRADAAAVVAVIAVGGAIGATARYLIGLAWPTPLGGFPWATLVINVTGCALIGVLMVVVTDVLTRQRLLRPFLGTGVLGGFTTFSTYAVDIHQLVANGHPGTALLYLAGTAAGALIAVWMTANATRALINWRMR
ncbi:MAG: fluoride exporter [Kribbellaceae bacterium]|jgi:CrcB protein|nr:fluoride exporter [Kribbellaceae bacterium]